MCDLRNTSFDSLVNIIYLEGLKHLHIMAILKSIEFNGYSNGRPFSVCILRLQSLGYIVQKIKKITKEIHSLANLMEKYEKEIVIIYNF